MTNLPTIQSSPEGDSSNPSRTPSNLRLLRLLRIALVLTVLAVAVNVLLSGPVEDWWWSRKSLAELGREAISQPGNPRLQFQLGRKLEAAGKHEEALVAFATALRLQPDDRRIYVETATAMVEAGHLDPAEGLLAGALERWPKEGSLRLAYADVLARLDLWAAAAEEQARALADLAPAERTARRYGALASFYMELPDFPRASKAFQEAIRIRADEPGVQRGLGHALIEMRRPQEALTSLETALRQDPKDSQAAFLLGRAALAAGDRQRGESLLRQVIKANPNQPRAHLELGKLEASSKGWSAAVRHYSAALRADPRYAEAYEALAEALLKTGRPKEAEAASLRARAVRTGRERIAQLEAHLKSEPEDARTLRELVQRYKDEGRYRQASRRLLQLLTLRPKDSVGLRLRREFETLRKSGLEIR